MAMRAVSFTLVSKPASSGREPLFFTAFEVAAVRLQMRIDIFATEEISAIVRSRAVSEGRTRSCTSASFSRAYSHIWS